MLDICCGLKKKKSGSNSSCNKNGALTGTARNGSVYSRSTAQWLQTASYFFPFSCSGIGIVNAIEVVHAFPEEDGLKKFREWVESPDPSIFGKLYPHIGGDKTRRRSSKANSTNADESASSDGTQADGSQSSSGGLLDVKRVFMEKHVSFSHNCAFPSFLSDEAAMGSM